jgi:hypothetical protein
MDSLVLDWTIGRAALPSATASSRLTVVGFGVLTGAVREELAFADTEIVRKSVVGSVACVARPSALPKITSNPTCRILN